MKADLESLKNEIAIAIEQTGFAVFHTASRDTDSMMTVRWNTDRYPDPRLFLETARKVGAKMVLVHQRQFESSAIEEALEDLGEAGLPREQHRDFERKLRKLHDYEGFTCLIELAFALDNVWYAYQVITPWFDDFLTLSGHIQDILEAADEDEEDSGPGSLGGYFSQN